MIFSGFCQLTNRFTEVRQAWQSIGQKLLDRQFLPMLLTIICNKMRMELADQSGCSEITKRGTVL